MLRLTLTKFDYDYNEQKASYNCSEINKADLFVAVCAPEEIKALVEALSKYLSGMFTTAKE